MSVNNFLNPFNSSPEVLNCDILTKISCFMLYAPQFKNDILLAQASNWPATEPPVFLPKSVSALLSNLCEIDEDSTHTLWSSLKNTAWEYDDKAKMADERFKLYGKELGCSEHHFKSYRSIHDNMNHVLNSVFIPSSQLLHT